MSDMQQVVLIVLAPIAVYGLARLVFTAYFRSKADYMRRFFSHGNIDKTEGNNESGNGPGSDRG